MPTVNQNSCLSYLSKYQYPCQRSLVWLIVLSLCFAVMGCSHRYSDLPAFSPIPIRDYENRSVGRFKSSHLAKQIDHYYNGINPGPIGVTTLVNLDDLYTTSTFGRVYAEQLMSELSMLGYEVVELRHADALQFLNTTGEFGLSRDTGMIRRERDLGGVVVGTYVVSPVRVYVNARLVDPSTSLILSAGSVEMSKTKEISRLVRGGSFAPTLERIPVKHLGLKTFPYYGSPYNGQYVDPEEAGFGMGMGGPMMPMRIPAQPLPDKESMSMVEPKLDMETVTKPMGPDERPPS